MPAGGREVKLPADEAGLEVYTPDLAKRGAPVIRWRLSCLKSGATDELSATMPPRECTVLNLCIDQHHLNDHHGRCPNDIGWEV
jgi:hypothetical protein